MIDMRDKNLEKSVQKALDNGHNVWVIGDVHGFYRTFTRLLKRFELNPKDVVILLGDLIDRGPESAQVIQHVRTSPSIFTVRGNHESMMASAVDKKELISYTPDANSWYRNGGIATISSYLKIEKDPTQVLRRVNSDIDWIESLPTEIVLDQYRLVHAGYDSRIDVEEQDEETHMWVRRPFFETVMPVDENRQVIFGHTVTCHLPKFSKSDLGKVWNSDLLLSDGRSAMIGLDTCLYHFEPKQAFLSGLNLQTGEVIQQERVEEWNKKIDNELRMDSAVHGFYID